jgi:hypothetical protein
MREIKDRQDAASDVDPIVAALADDIPAAAAVTGLGDEAEADEASGLRPADGANADENDDPSSARLDPVTATYADTVVELEAPADDDDGPLLDDELEHGIASVFAALHAAAQGDAAPVEPLGDLEAADGVTFRLLGELDRIWHRAA